MSEEIHTQFMREALAEAEIALKIQEVPVGVVIVYQGEVIGRGSNKTNIKRDATRHAEYEAIDMILLRSEGKYTSEIFQQCTLYVTCEPCIMCAAALAILKKWYMGVVMTGLEDVVQFWMLGIIGADPMPQPYNCITGVLKQECIDVLQRFYEQENPNAPVPNKKS